MCVQPPTKTSVPCCRIPVTHVRAVYNGFIDSHKTKEEHFDWLVQTVLVADMTLKKLKVINSTFLMFS